MKHLIKLQGAMAVIILMITGCQNEIPSVSTDAANVKQVTQQQKSKLKESPDADLSTSTGNTSTRNSNSETDANLKGKQEQKDVQKDPLLDAIHTDSFEMDGDKYKIGYWNEGEFDFTRFVIQKNGIVAFDSRK